MPAAPPAGCGLELGPLRPRQAQRIGQQPRGLLAGGGVDPAFQVADRPRGKGRRLRQLLLRQPGIGAQLPQQRAETPRRPLRHRPLTPPKSPAARRHVRRCRLGPGLCSQAYKPATGPHRRWSRGALRSLRLSPAEQGQLLPRRTHRHGAILWVSCGPACVVIPVAAGNSGISPQHVGWRPCHGPVTRPIAT